MHVDYKSTDIQPSREMTWCPYLLLVIIAMPDKESFLVENDLCTPHTESRGGEAGGGGGGGGNSSSLILKILIESQGHIQR